MTPARRECHKNLSQRGSEPWATSCRNQWATISRNPRAPSSESAEITTKIISELDAGRLPWVQPWGTAAAKAPLAMPRNAATGRHYSGINVLILWGAVVQHGYPCQSWLTFRQALALGGHVRRGEHGTTIVYADRFIPDDEKRRAGETGEDAQAVPFLKRFTVFNALQCEGLPDDVAVAAPPPEPGLIEPKVAALIKASRWATIRSVPLNQKKLAPINLMREICA